jgi:hypothetical protein
MSYKKFKISDLENHLKLNVSMQKWLPDTMPTFPKDELLLQNLFYAETESLHSEKARSEFIIAPTLQALRRQNMDKFTLFSGYEFNVDKKSDLNGFCDYIISAKTHKLTIQAPIFCIVEAKKIEPSYDDFAQCGAEMYAAQLHNAQEAFPNNIIFDCATSGFSWAFLHLQNNHLRIDPNYIPLTFKNPFLVLELLQWIIDQSITHTTP